MWPVFLDFHKAFSITPHHHLHKLAAYGINNQTLKWLKTTRLFVTGFWETYRIVTCTLGLFHFISPANGYTCTLHIHIESGLVEWSAFPEQVLPTL